MNYFVYIGAGRHLWRFVWFGEATDPDAAIDAAVAEAREMGNTNVGATYLAVPMPEAHTRWVSASVEITG